MRRLAAAGLLMLGACDPIWQVGLTVRDPADRPVPGAAVMLVCPPGATAPSTTKRTDDAGKASIGGLGSSLPARCTLGVARPGYSPQRTTLEKLCGDQPLDRCERVREEQIILTPTAL